MSFIFANVISLNARPVPFPTFHLSSLRRKQDGCSGSSMLKVKLVKALGQADPVKPGSIWSEKALNPELEGYDGEQDTTSFLCMFTGSASNRKKIELQILFRCQLHLRWFRTNSKLLFSHCGRRYHEIRLDKCYISSGRAHCCGQCPGFTLRGKTGGNTSLNALLVLPRPSEHNHLGLC